MKRIVLALILGVVWSTAAAARVYSQAELADFNIAGVKLDMSLDDAIGALKAHGYAGSLDAKSRVSNFSHDGGAVVSVERGTDRATVSAVGMLQTLPKDVTDAQIQSEIVPAMIKRFGDPTRREKAGAVTVLLYASSENPGAGAISMTLRISSAGIDGRLGR